MGVLGMLGFAARDLRWSDWDAVASVVLAEELGR
jgi:hypothetical protein